MPVFVSASFRARRLGTLTGLLAALLALLVIVMPGTAAAAGGPKPIPHPERDWMGSTVRRHEGGLARGVPAVRQRASVEGVDVSSHQGDVDWAALWTRGVHFAYVKATEGTSYTNPYFPQQYDGSYDAGMIRGAYHFALPGNSSGSAQAEYFVKHGGGWTKDGRTLPGVLDIEYNPYGAACFGKTPSGMVGWIRDFLDTYRELTGRHAVIYTTAAWWKTCTGNYSGFAGTSPLWIARYASDPGTLPAGWRYCTFWQYTSSGPIVGDHDRFNGTYARLRALADG